MTESMTHAYLKEFEKECKFRSLAPEGIAGYMSDLSMLFEYLTSDVRQVTQAELEDALFQLKIDRSLKEVTLNRKITSTRVFFQFLHQRGYTTKNPAENLPSAKRIKGIPTWLEREEMQKLLKVSEHNLFHHTILHTYYEVGLRLSELINLQIPDVDSASMRMRIVGKGRKTRYLDFSQALLQKLRKIVKMPNGCRSKGYLFLRPDLSPLTPSYVQNIVKHYARKAGIIKNVCPKRIRHTYATHSLAAGVDLLTLKENLGHSDLSSTRIYAKVTPAHSRKSFQKFVSYAFPA